MASTPTVTVDTRTLPVEASEGLEFQEAGLPSVYIPPNAVSQDAELSIAEVKNPPSWQDAKLSGNVFDISLSEESLHAPIEVALPIQNLSIASGEDDQVTIAYYQDGLDGWLSCIGSA